ERYAARRAVLRSAFAEAGWVIDHSEAGLYLWVTHPAHDCWSAAELLAADGGILVAPGELYGPAGKRHVRVALTATDGRVAAAAARPRPTAVRAPARPATGPGRLLGCLRPVLAGRPARSARLARSRGARRPSRGDRPRPGST